MDRKPTEAELEKRREKAKNLRYRKAIAKSLNIQEMRDELYQILEDCEEIRYSIQSDDILSDLLGDEDDILEFRMQFTDLECDAERMIDDIEDKIVPECFDLFLGAFAGHEIGMLGYDMVGEDYFTLESMFEVDLAAKENEKKITRLTKKEIIESARNCFTAAFCFIGLQNRYDNLSAAIDIIKGRNGGVLQAVKALEDAYEKAAEKGFRKYEKATEDFDRIAKSLPDEVWIQ